MIGRVVDVLFEQTQTITVQAQCSAYVPPQVTEEDQCEKCNTDYKDYVDENGKPQDMRALKVCSEYRCKSLGASCELINEGTENELCVSTSQYDTAAPIISPWATGLDLFYQNAIQQTQNGYRITQELPIYNNVNMAIETDEPAQCKMSFEHSKKFEEMPDYFFGGSAYDYFHLQTIFFSQATEENMLAFSQGGGKYTIYIRCQDAQGNQNENDYSIEVTISQEPDITAPIIETTSLGTDAYLTANASQTPVMVFVSEPAECRYSLNNERFDTMPEGCTTQSIPNSQGTYECHFGDDTTNAGPMIEGFTLGAGDTGYAFFKCQDLAGNANKESFTLTLHGTKELSITSIQPTGEIFTSVSQQNITLKVITAQGADLNGNAVCRYTDQEELQNNQAAMIPFLNTNSSIHTQPLTLAAGEHTYYVLCADKAGNIAQNQTTMSITADTYAPLLIRAYKVTTVTPPVFKIKTNEPAQCEYTLDGPFSFGEGNPFVQEPENLHTAAGDADIYYIICKDNYHNSVDLTTISFIY